MGTRMQVFAFVAGTIVFVLSTIIRAIFGRQQVGLSKKSVKDIFGIPSKDDVDSILVATGQFMGILWIIIGFILARLTDWNGLGLWGRVTLEGLLVISPLFLYHGAVWWLKKNQENKS